MAIFQPTEILVRDQQTIQLVFNSPPSLLLSKDNFEIVSTFSNVSNLDILSIEIDNTTITLNTKPQFPDNLYIISLLDLPTQPFEDIHNVELAGFIDARQIYFLGIEDINTVRDTMLQNLPDNYDVGEQTLVRDITTVIADEIYKASITIQEVKNDNYISIPVIDELYTRGHGPNDRLRNENAYQVDRVAKTPTDTSAQGLKTFDPVADPNIPFEVINLRVQQQTEVIPNDTSTSKFDGFLITTSKQFVTRLISVELNPGEVVYDPTLYGYALLNNNYDRFARSSPFLTNSQILLSPLTNNAFPEPLPGDELEVIYEFDNVGRRVERSSVSLYSIGRQVNEIVPANVSNFYLEEPNIVNQFGQEIVKAGVRFTISTINLTQHPAFLREIVFNTDTLPSSPGEYTIDYKTGQVFVFGTQNTIGTGMIPPVATYYYKNIATHNTDYFISDDGYNVSLNPFSEFASQQFVISFLYEDVFTPGVDYIVSSHNEVLNERVDNRLVDDFTIRVNHSPVKDIHQIRNETTGEFYTPGRVERDRIYFTGNRAPTTNTTLGELARVGIVDDEVLNVGIPATTPNGLLRVFPIDLAKEPVLSQRQDGIGNNFNTSIQLTRTDLFLNEYYFNSFESVMLNLGKLQIIGDYLVDYTNGIMYVAVADDQTFDVGHISYAYGAFIPTYRHVLDVSSIGIGTTSTHLIQDFAVGTFDDGIIIPRDLNYCYDLFDGITRVPNSDGIFVAQLQDDFTLYTKHPIKKVYGVYTQNDLDSYGMLDLANKNLYDSSTNLSVGTLIDLKTYIVLPVEADTMTYYKVVIPDITTNVQSVRTVDTGIELLNDELNLTKYANIIVNEVVPSPSINPTTATITLQNVIELDDPTLNTFVDIAGRHYPILSITGGSEIEVSVPNFIAPTPNPGSQILDTNGILVANHLNVISRTELPNSRWILHYDVMPSGILPGYQVRDYVGNVFSINDVQTTSVVVVASNPAILPAIDPVAAIETQSLLTPGIGDTTILNLPIDVPVSVGMNLRIGYVPESINQLVIQAQTSTLSAGGAGMVIDYSIGQYFLDYRHLDDELLVSYDWGDNQLDWSISNALVQGETFYTSYKYGASRAALQTNFAPLTSVNFLQTAPLTITRETYRNAVGGALKAFLKGPTYEAIRILAHTFTQIDPDVQEANLNQWIVGREPLNLQEPTTTGAITFGNGKYGEGLVITGNNSIQLPGVSSMRLSQGTFSTWFRPNWNGNQADEDVVFTLPSAMFSVFYNAHTLLPTEVEENPWQLVINSDAYGTAQVYNNQLEIRNSKNEFDDGIYPSNEHYIYENDAYWISSTALLHTNLVDIPYSVITGKYIWQRNEITLSPINDLDINFVGKVDELYYANQIQSVIKVNNVAIDDGYAKYSTGFYLFKKSLYNTSVILEDVHLTIEPPYPHHSPPIMVSTNIGSNVVDVADGYDTSSLTVGQQIIIGTAYPELTNIIALTPTTIVMRFVANTTLTDVLVENLDPDSTPGTQDGYGEIHLRDKLGTRPDGTTDIRTNGWDRQLLVKLQLSPYALGYMMVIGSSDPPLTTEAPIIDFADNLIPGVDVFVDGYGNVFELDHVEVPYIWVKKPSASGVDVPIGLVSLFSKVVGVQFADDVLISIPTNWSNYTSYAMTKRDGVISLTASQQTIEGSYVSHFVVNSVDTSNVGFGMLDDNIDAKVSIQHVNYNIHSILGLNDIYMGNTGRHPTSDIVPFKYETSNTGIPAIGTDKYFAIFTSKASANENEPADQVIVKAKLPSSWEIDDGTDTLELDINPTIAFSTTTTGDLINIVDAYGMSFESSSDAIYMTGIDTAPYIPGNVSILLDDGPELRVAVGKQHYLFDVETKAGALRLYRTGTGYLTAETQLSDSSLFNIRADITSWAAGQLHHIAMSWKIGSPDETDELHLFIDGDEAPNEVMFGNTFESGTRYSSIYEEPVEPVFRVASSDGEIVNNLNGSGVFIPDSAPVQPDSSWVNKTIVLNAVSLGTNDFLDMPLIVGAVVEVVGGNMLFLSLNGEQIDFSMYGPSTPILYGLATYAVATYTTLVRTNFGVFKDGEEFMGPSAKDPQFRQVGITQVVELYDVDPETGHYIENVESGDVITIRTYGLLTQTINDRVYQFGSLIRSSPIVVDNNYGNGITSVDVVINNGSTAFFTDLPPPVDPTQVQAIKILLPRTLI